MRKPLFVARRARRMGGVMALSWLALAASAQTPPGPPPASAAASPAARAAIANRKAIFTLIGNNFRPIAEALRQGTASPPVEAGKYAARVGLLADFLPEAFPDISSNGDTRARVEIWNNRADFKKRLQDFHDHAAQLAQAGSRRDNDAFKTTASAVAQDCKSCHERYRGE